MAKFKIDMVDETDYPVVAKLPDKLKKYITIQASLFWFLNFNIAIQVK